MLELTTICHCLHLRTSSGIRLNRQIRKPDWFTFSYSHGSSILSGSSTGVHSGKATNSMRHGLRVFNRLCWSSPSSTSSSRFEQKLSNYPLTTQTPTSSWQNIVFNSKYRLVWSYSAGWWNQSAREHSHLMSSSETSRVCSPLTTKLTEM